MDHCRTVRQPANSLAASAPSAASVFPIDWVTRATSMSAYTRGYSLAAPKQIQLYKEVSDLICKGSLQKSSFQRGNSSNITTGLHQPTQKEHKETQLPATRTEKRPFWGQVRDTHRQRCDVSPRAGFFPRACHLRHHQRGLPIGSDWEAVGGCCVLVEGRRGLGWLRSSGKWVLGWFGVDLGEAKG